MSSRPMRRERRSRRGNVVIITALSLPVFLAFVAFAIDWGHIAAAQGQLQNAADSAALAAGAKVVEDRSDLYLYTPDMANSVGMGFYSSAREEAKLFAGKNKCYGTALDLNTQQDVEFFYMDPSTKELKTGSPSNFNTVRVTTRRTDALNGPLPLFFSGIWGMGEAPLVAVAQATFWDDINQIGPPPRGERSSLMPFAIHKDHWKKLMDAMKNPGVPIDLDGDGKPDISDGYKYNESTDSVSKTGDNIPELRMFPDASGKNGVLTPGNFGTVDIGDGSNSAADLKRQILDGPNGADFAKLPNGKLDFSTPFVLDGDTGISGGIADALQTIQGETRTIVIYDQTYGNGDNAQFNIISFAGVRVMNTDLTGQLKGIFIQPAPVTDPGALPGSGPKHNVYGPIFLSK